MLKLTSPCGSFSNILAKAKAVIVRVSGCRIRAQKIALDVCVCVCESEQPEYGNSLERV